MQRNYFLVSIILLLVVGAVVGGVYWYTEQNGFVDPDQLQITEPNKAMAGTLAYQQGSVVVRIDGSDWQVVETDTILHSGDQISTGDDSKAIIEFENGDVLRLGYTTEVTLTELGTKQVVITQTSGATYNRVAKAPDRTYTISNDDVLITALGTAFDVVDSEEEVAVGVIESTVAVDANAKETKTVEQGSKATVDKEESKIAVSELKDEELTNDWYTWNKEEDSKRYTDLGVLGAYAGPDLTVTEPTDGQTVTTATMLVSGTVGADATGLTIQDQAVDITNGTFSHELTLAAGKNTIRVVATDADGNRTVKELVVKFETPATETPLKLDGATTADGVVLEWNRSTASTFDQYKVLRSVNNDLPSYPGGDVIAALRSGEERYTDTSGSAEGTYYYRVCEVMTDGQSFCSNVLHMRGKQATEPEPEPEEDRVGIFLSGSAADNGITLKWTVENITVTDGYKVVRSIEENPTYPEDTSERLSESSARSYTWQVTDGKTYHFRVCQYVEGSCTVYSNDVAIVAPSPSENVTITMSAKAESTGVGLWWTDVSDIANFKYYKVVRSEHDADPVYPEDGYIAVKDEGALSHRDFSAHKGTAYYYRICAVGNSIYCSNVVRVTAIHDNPEPSAVTLSGTIAGTSLVFSWTKSNESDFSAYKVVWSQTDPTPTYPDSKYLKPISSASEITYTDTGDADGQRKESVDVMSGTHYYSVCVLDSWDQVACSNTITIINGVVQ